jgi:hypothetical protein
MDTRTGEIRTLAPGERPGPHKVPLTSEQAKSLSRLTPHGAARPAGLTDDEWRAQKNAAKRQRRARRGL